MPDGMSGLHAPLRVLSLGVNWFDAGSGGLDRVYHDLTVNFQLAGIQAHGLVLGPPDAAQRSGGLVQPFDQGGGRLGRLWRARRAVAHHLAANDTDLVAVHFALFGLPALDVLRDRPLVMHFHGPWADEAAAEGAGGLGLKIRHLIERTVYRRAGRVITLSRAFADVVSNAYGVDPLHVRVVPGSVDLAHLAPTMSREAARARLGWPAKPRILFAVRRLVRRMGLDRLIEAMPAICAASPGTILMIAGRGAEQANLQNLAQSCNVAEHVRFLGFLPDDDLPLAYRAADINVVPSLALEGFGLTAAESLAAGTASMVTPVGGLPEVVATLSPGLVFHSTRSRDIADGLIAALLHGVPDEAACLRHAHAHFAPARAAGDVARIYREAASCPTI